KVQTVWQHYSEKHSYEAADHAAKRDFVTRYANQKSRGMVWDLGSNVGTFSRICAANAELFVSMDGDSHAIDRLYDAERRNPDSRILPIVVDLANPSPAQGWRGRERKPLEARGKPDLLVCLALLHHLVISANIPLWEIVDWLSSLDSDLIVEFVTRGDAMTQ